MAAITTTPKQRRSGRFKLACLIGIPVATVILSTLMFKTGIGVPEATKNKGTLLIPPQNILDLPLTTNRNTPFHYNNGAKWSLIIPIKGQCGQECMNRLHLTRQVHISLGKNANALRRYYLNMENQLPQKVLNLLEKEHPKLKVIHSTPTATQRIAHWIPSNDSEKLIPYLLVDPRGFIMMYYTDKNTGNELLADLKFLISKSSGH